MGITEKQVIAEENKKQHLLETNMQKYEEKKKLEDFFENENRKKNLLHKQEMLKNGLDNQILGKHESDKLTKDINNYFVK